jgi:hypothetical protein
MHWIESAGGPLMLLSEALLGNWGGVLDLMSGPAVDVSYSPNGKSTDYDRACSVKGYLDLIDVCIEQAIVLGGEPLRTSWVAHETLNGGMLIRWIFGESEAEFLSWIDEIPESIFQRNGTFSVKKQRLILFDSAVAGRNVKKRSEEYISIELIPGVYEIKTAIYQPDARTFMVVHRLKPSASKGIKE